jgi:hypothetical protein
VAEWLKRGEAAEVRAQGDRKVRDTVEAILADIEARGDVAVRELSIKFDGWDRDDYRLSKAEIQGCIDQLSGQDLKDIEFAQTQVRNFARCRGRNAAWRGFGAQEYPTEQRWLLCAGRQISAARLGTYERDYSQGGGCAARFDVCAALCWQAGAGDCGGAGDGGR